MLDKVRKLEVQAGVERPMLHSSNLISGVRALSGSTGPVLRVNVQLPTLFLNKYMHLLISDRYPAISLSIA